MFLNQNIANSKRSGVYQRIFHALYQLFKPAIYLNATANGYRFLLLMALLFGLNSSQLLAEELKAEAAQPVTIVEEQEIDYNAVKIQVLNKVTARSSELVIPVGNTNYHSTIEIIAKTCKKSPVGEKPENAVLIQISELKSGEEPKQVFNGWMFSSSPALSGLEHPVYDVTIIECSIL